MKLRSWANSPGVLATPAGWSLTKARLRPSAFAIVADLLLADGRIDARERKFLQRLAVNFNIRARVANHVIEAMLVKNHL